LTTATANAYTLPSMVTVNGTFKFYVLCDNATLTAPTIQTIKTVGPTKATANILAGISEIGNVTITIRDDYSDGTHPEGFWYAAVQGECWLRIDLDEGAGDVSYFFGMIDKKCRNGVRWTEHYVDSSTRIRTAEIEFISMARKIFDMDISAWISDGTNGVLDNCAAVGIAPGTGDASHVIKITELFECLLTVTGLNSLPGPFSAADVSYVYGSQRDMYWGDGISAFHLDDLYVPVKFVSNTVGPVYTTVQLFDVTGTSCLAVQSDGTGFYSSMDGLLKDLLFNLGLQMTVGFNTGTSRHTITLTNLKDVYSGTVTFGTRLKGSSVLQSTRFLADAVRTTRLIDSTKFRWQSLTYCEYGSALTPDSRIKFDIDQKTIFIVDAAATGAANCSLGSWAGAGNALNYMTGCNYFSLDSPIVKTSGQEEACTTYAYYFFTIERRAITRKYSQLQAYSGSWAQTNIGLMRRTPIDDLVSTKNWFANSVTKDPTNSELEVEWVEEP
jgi:hypothetical protein